VWRGAPADLLQRAAELTGARLLRPSGAVLPVLDGGVDVVFDCLGSAASTELSLRLLRAGGTFMLCGRSGRHEIEWPLVWARELTVCGSALYGREPNGRRTFGVVREWLTDSSFPVDGLVTHRFPLDEFDAALNTATAGVAAGAVKVVFQGSVASMRTRLDKAAEHDFADEPLLGATAARIRVRASTGQG
jgi:threonine dehydrogenase-like Zn-dependent dehydrogenase